MRYIVLIISVFLFTTLSFSQTDKQQNTEAIKGKKAPNFVLTDIDGNSFELQKNLGEGPVLLSFWATWCKPCLEELNEYQKIVNEFAAKGFKMYGISTDNEKTVAKVKPFVKSKNYKFKVLLDTNSEVARKYYAQQIPFSVLIDKKGQIIYSHLGYMKGDEKKVRSLIEAQLEK